MCPPDSLQHCFEGCFKFVVMLNSSILNNSCHPVVKLKKARVGDFPDHYWFWSDLISSLILQFLVQRWSFHSISVSLRNDKVDCLSQLIWCWESTSLENWWCQFKDYEMGLGYHKARPIAIYHRYWRPPTRGTGFKSCNWWCPSIPSS